MQEINLLQNKLKDTSISWEKNNRALTVLLCLVIVAELVAGVMFYILTQTAKGSKLAMDQENSTLQSQLDAMQDDLAEAKGFQAQTKNIATLLESHVNWAPLIDGLASSTFVGSRYLSMSSDTAGVIHVEGVTPTYPDLGKLLLALETNKDLVAVKLLSTAPSKDKLAGVIFSLEITVSQDIFLKD